MKKLIILISLAYALILNSAGLVPADYQVADSRTPPSAPKNVVGNIIQMMPGMFIGEIIPDYHFAGLTYVSVIYPPKSSQIIWYNFPDSTTGGVYTTKDQMIPGDTVAVDTNGARALGAGKFIISVGKAYFIIRSGR
jgi:hypothetical protein